MITSAGSGPANSAMKSNSLRSPIESSSHCVSDSMFGRRACIERTLNTFAASRRRRCGRADREHHPQREIVRELGEALRFGVVAAWRRTAAGGRTTCLPCRGTLASRPRSASAPRPGGGGSNGPGPRRAGARTGETDRREPQDRSACSRKRALTLLFVVDVATHKSLDFTGHRSKIGFAAMHKTRFPEDPQEKLNVRDPGTDSNRQ